MSIQAAIASHLIHDSRVALAVSSNEYPEPRVFHLIAPPGTRYPYITFQIMPGTVRERHMENVCGLVHSTVQMNIWGRSTASVSDTHEAVRKSLDHAHHRDIGRAPNAETIGVAILEDSFDDYAPSEHAEETGVIGIVQLWTIWHTESLPELAV